MVVYGLAGQSCRVPDVNEVWPTSDAPIVRCRFWQMLRLLCIMYRQIAPSKRGIHLRRSCGKVVEHTFRLEEQLPQPVFVGCSTCLPPLRGPGLTGNTELTSYDPLIVVTLCTHLPLSRMYSPSHPTRAKLSRPRDIQFGYS